MTKPLLALAFIALLAAVEVFSAKQQGRQNFFVALDVTRDSPKSEIKKHYYDLSRKYHPDKNEEDTTELFIKVKEGYDTLTHQRHRNKYDALGQTDFSQEEKMEAHLRMQFKGDEAKISAQVEEIESGQMLI